MRALVGLLSLLLACNRGEPPGPSEPPPPPLSRPVVPSASAVASVARPDPLGSELGASLAALVGLDGADAKVVAALGQLGIDPKSLPGKGRTVKAQGLLSRQLDTDPALEAIAHVRLEGEDGPTKRVVALYVAWIDQGKVVAGRRFLLETCSYTATIEVRAERVHDKAYDDTVVDSEAITACDGHAGTVTTTVLTLARGKPEQILEVKDDFAYTQTSGKLIDPKALVRFDDGGVVIEEEGKGSKELSFDPVAFKYQ